MINHLMIQLNNNDYTTGCLLHFDYFGKNYRIIAVDLSKQKALDADSRAIQQIIFTGEIKAAVANTRVIIISSIIIIINSTYK